jgi:peptide deformylase
MKIIQPHHAISRPVTAWADIKTDASELVKMVNGKFTVGRWKEALALHHSQVTLTPFNFFVVHQDLKEAFGHEVIMNCRIVDVDDRTTFKEACMSYPFRPEIKTLRYRRVIVDFEYKGLFGLKTERRGLLDIAAFVAQHECDHAKGKCIY